MTSPSPDQARVNRALRWILALALLAILLRAVTYYLNPGLPWAYARDLGFDYASNEYFRHFVHTPTDFYDALAWCSWLDIPQFFYNSQFLNVFTVPLTDLARDGWQGIKLFHILFLAGAAAGGYALMRQFGRPRGWSLLGGILYASMPLIALNVHNALALFFSPAVLPWCFYFSIALVRKFGARSLPFCATICAFAGTVPHVEFFFFTSIPVYVLIAVYVLVRPGTTRLDWAYAVVGLPFLVLPSAYYVLPTRAQHVLGNSALQETEATAQVFVAYFSETIGELLALVPRTQLLDPEPITNFTSIVPIALGGGVFVWWLAVSRISDLNKLRTAIVFAIVAALTILGLGPRAPIVGSLWHTLAYIPLLNALRTPDRFLAIPCLFAALAAADRLWLFTTKAPPRTRSAAVVAAFALLLGIVAIWIVDIPNYVVSNYIFPGFSTYVDLWDLIWRACATVTLIGLVVLDFRLSAPRLRGILAGGSAAVILLSFFAFSYYAHVWDVENDVNNLEPHLAEINAIAARLDHRSAPLLTAQKGGHIDGAGYGIPVPRILSIWELGSRFGVDGIGGMGVFGRDGFASILASNMWARKYQELGPDWAAIYRQIKIGRNVFDGSDGNLLVKAIDRPDDPVMLSRPLCLTGGPGLIDHLLALPSLQGFDYLDSNAPCAGQLYQSFDALDSLTPERSLAWYPVKKLCPGTICHVLQDSDFTFATERFLLNQPWYRNSLDGDDPVFDKDGAALLTNGIGKLDREFEIPLPQPLPAGAFLVMHYASHVYTTMQVRFPNGGLRTLRLLPSHGLRWAILPLDGVSCPDASKCAIDVDATIDGFYPDRSNYTWYGVALDGAAIVTGDELNAIAHSGGAGAVVFSSAAFDAAVDPSYRQYDDVDPAKPWTGPPGNYTIGVMSDVPREGRLTLAIPSERIDASTERRFDSGEARTIVFARTSLRPGDALDVKVADRDGRPVKAEHLHVTVVSVQPQMTFYNPGSGVFGSNVLFSEGPRSLAQVQTVRGLNDGAFSIEHGLTGKAGAVLALRIRSSNTPTQYAVGTAGTTGKGTLHLALYCGKTVGTQIINADFSNNVLGLIATAPYCTLYVTWEKEFSVQRLYVYQTPLATLRQHTRLWIPAGAYTLESYLYDLTPVKVPPALRIDGKPMRSPIVVAANGYHDVDITTVSAKNSFFFLRPVTGVFSQTWPPPPSGAKQEAVLRYSITLSGRSALKIAHLNDGNWVLAGNGPSPQGYTCDLLATCFPDVAPGTYTIEHRWSPATAAGIALFVLSIPLSLIVLFFPGRALRREGSA